MIAHLRITCATGISRLRGDPLLHPYRLPTIGSSLKIHPQLLPISAFTYDMKYHSRIQNEMQGVEMKSKGRKAALTFQKVHRIDKRFASASLGGILRVPPKKDCEEMIYIFSQPLIT